MTKMLHLESTMQNSCKYTKTQVILWVLFEIMNLLYLIDIQLIIILQIYRPLDFG